MVQLQPQPLKPPLADQRIFYAGISWEQFKLIQVGFGPTRSVRLSYYNHTIEILMPGREHEFFKTIIGMLIELFCLEMNLEFEPLGSTTQEQKPETAAEPDESYCFGGSKPRPDLAIEVIFNSSNVHKLQRYLALQIPEVWFWEDGLFRLYHLSNSDYEPIAQSIIPELAALDIELLTRCVLLARTSRLDAAKTFRQALKAQQSN